jgi:hypothetical protein
MPASLARATVPSMSESCGSAVELQRLLRHQSAQRTARGELRCREARVLGSGCGCGCGITEIMNDLIAELLGL